MHERDRGPPDTRLGASSAGSLCPPSTPFEDLAMNTPPALSLSSPRVPVRVVIPADGIHLGEGRS